MINNLKIDKFRGERIYSDIYANTVIRQGYLREVEIYNNHKLVLVLYNKLAVKSMIKELQNILNNWV